MINTFLTKCSACGKKLPDGIMYFCSPCWWKLPAQERASLHRMVCKRLDVDSKVAKCVRILREQNARTNTKPVKAP